jgi:hypothetical protein
MMLFISFGGIRSYWNPNSTPIPAVQSATSASLYRPIEGVEFNATLSQINCTRRSSRPCSRANARAASAPSISKRFGPVQQSDSDDFRVVGYPLQLSEPDREEPGSDSMVEEKRFGMSPLLFWIGAMYFQVS